MTTLQIILLSLLSGIYLERGRQWIIRKIQERRFKSMLDTRMNEFVKSFSDVLKSVSERDEIRRQHAAEDRLSNNLPFAGGFARGGFVPRGGGEVIINRDGSIADTRSLEDQLKDALEHEEFERAAVLRDKMKQR